MVNQVQAKEVFDRHYSEAELFLSQYRTGIEKNQAITHFYQQMVTQYPAMQWFAIAAMVSAAVGKSISYTNPTAQNIVHALMQDPPVESTTESIALTEQLTKQISNVHDGLCAGNQEIFKNMFAVCHTYCELGIAGLKQVQSYDKDNNNETSVTKDVIDAFSSIEKLTYNPFVTSAFSEYMMAQALGTSNTFALKPQAATALVDIAVKFTKHEQTIVSPMYAKESVEGMETIGDTLNSAIQNPLLASLFDQLKLFGPTIAGKYIPFTLEHGDIASFDDRMNYFEKELSSAYFSALKTPGGVAYIIAEGNTIISQFDIHYSVPQVAYIYHENNLFNMLYPQQTPNIDQLLNDLFGTRCVTEVEMTEEETCEQLLALDNGQSIFVLPSQISPLEETRLLELFAHTKESVEFF